MVQHCAHCFHSKYFSLPQCTLGLTIHADHIQALQDLCVHGEYCVALREELNLHFENSLLHVDSLPCLDSFVKESARTNCFEAGES